MTVKTRMGRMTSGARPSGFTCGRFPVWTASVSCRMVPRSQSWLSTVESPSPVTGRGGLSEQSCVVPQPQRTGCEKPGFTHCCHHLLFNSLRGSTVRWTQLKLRPGPCFHGAYVLNEGGSEKSGSTSEIPDGGECRAANETKRPDTVSPVSASCRMLGRPIQDLDSRKECFNLGRSGRAESSWSPGLEVKDGAGEQGGHGRAAWQEREWVEGRTESGVGYQVRSEFNLSAVGGSRSAVISWLCLLKSPVESSVSQRLL